MLKRDASVQQSEKRLPRAVSMAESPNSGLIGRADARRCLSTPCLVLDLDAFEANIARMAEVVRSAGLGLRPHAKSHKCSEIARRQIEAGAVGVCCATVAEAEAMAAAGVTGIHVSSPAVGEAKIRQLIGIASRSPATPLMVVVDHEQNLRQIAAAAEAAGLTIDVLIDLDPGMDRTGVVRDEDVVALALVAKSLAGVHYRGLQCYYGNLQHIASFAERSGAIETLSVRIEGLRAMLTAGGAAAEIVSGGGTGSAHIERATAFTELQAGSYVFMDVEYCKVYQADGLPLPFDPSLFISATVINSHRDGQSTIDAGTKAAARGWSMPTLTAPADMRIDYEFSGDEHGRLVYRDNANDRLAPGQTVELLTPHCDPTVALYAFYHCVRGNTLVDIWPIDARSQR